MTIRTLFQSLYGRKTVPLPGRSVVDLPTRPALVYAIGDVHGCLQQLRQLHDQIIADAENETGDKLIVMIGDYVDRGPHSAGVLDYLCDSPPDGFSRICLAGNHELMMLSYLRDPSDAMRWLDFGGKETLLSYGIPLDQYRAANRNIQTQILQSHIPDEHRAFLENLPMMLTMPGLVFAHAGLRDGVALSAQTEDDLLWLRYKPNVEPRGFPLLVHGHTPQANPVSLPSRICIDTGCYATGKLTAVRLRDGNKPIFLSTHANR